MSFFRYPGGKSKLKNKIVACINTIVNGDDLEYREPFFGGGGIGLKTLEDNSLVKKIWINDKDLGISCLWTSVINYPEILKSLVSDFVPSVQNFDNFKSQLTETTPNPQAAQKIAEYGFMKLAIHQISYSGLGTMSGGPLGGRKQDNIAGLGSTDNVKYPIDCRWSPNYICKKIDKLHQNLSQVLIRNNKCTNFDFIDLVSDDDYNAIIYLDPPYYNKGNALYQHGFSLDDHARLASTLKNTKHKWILSYDDCPEIREFYSWAAIQEIGVNYSITATKDKNTGQRLATTKTELLITRRKCCF